MVKTLVSNIQRYSTKDGPGIRSTLFLTGCSLKCLWCSNPELIEDKVQVLHFRARCHKCGECTKIDPSIIIEEDGAAAEHSAYKDKLVYACPFDAFEVNAKAEDVEEVFKTLMKDKTFYDASKGGVTISGGEPLLHPEFVVELLKKLKNEGVHTCIDTAGNVPLENIKQIVPYTDLILFDLKAYDPLVHAKCTGVSNHRILENFYFLNSIKMPMWIRMPLVHGYNDEEKDFRERLRLVKDNPNIQRTDILFYHEYGVGKYKALGKEYLVKNGTIDEENAEKIARIAAEENVVVNLIKE